jgi:hypothetical protein
MLYVRVSRDKRGYEYFHLIEPIVGAGGRTRHRLLYWFRTPPDVKVGRGPFDEATRREIEARHPELAFDWERYSQTPIPPIPVDWRQRRRAEKAARRSHLAEEQRDAQTTELPTGPSVALAGEAAPSVAPIESGAVRRRRRRRRGIAAVELSSGGVAGHPTTGEPPPALDEGASHLEDDASDEAPS